MELTEITNEVNLGHDHFVTRVIIYEICKLRIAMIFIFIIYRPGARGFGEIFPEVMIFPEGFSPSGGTINDILYRKYE